MCWRHRRRRMQLQRGVLLPINCESSARERCCLLFQRPSSSGGCLTATRAARQPFSQNTGRDRAVRERRLFHANHCTPGRQCPSESWETHSHSLALANKPTCLHFRNFGSDKHHASFGPNHFKTTLFLRSRATGWSLCRQLMPLSKENKLKVLFA